MHAQGIDGLGVRHRVGRQHTGAKIVAGAHGASLGQAHAGQAGVKPTRAAAMVAASNVVAAHVAWQGQITLAIGTHPLGRQLQGPNFGRAKMLDDFGAGAGVIAAVQNAQGWAAAHRVGVGQPPLRTL